jgi:peptide deformylase
MKILEYPDDHLRVTTKGVEKVTPEMVTAAQEMYQVMRIANGVGLAATQVGLDYSLVVLEDNGQPLILFNPVILKRAPKTEYSSEGCLSFPGVIRIIRRPVEVTVKYRDENNRMQYIVLRGLQARAMVHEYEHLFGKLFIDHEERQNDKST